jgi:hypothetical protein
MTTETATMATTTAMVGAGAGAVIKNDRNNNGVSDRVEQQWAKQDLRRARNFRTYPSDWNDQRVYVANNWNRRNNAYQQAQREALELQMKTQWQSYNPNYTGQYNWNTYNNPGFIDYVHNGNPGLFTRNSQLHRNISRREPNTSQSKAIPSFARRA